MEIVEEDFRGGEKRLTFPVFYFCSPFFVFFICAVGRRPAFVPVHLSSQAEERGIGRNPSPPWHSHGDPGA